MKYFLTLTLAFISFFLTAQSGTTLDEYRYLSKGYAYQIEMGLDPTKNGYQIRENYTAKNGTSIIGLYRTNSKIPQGLLLVTTDYNGKYFYQALPNPASTENVLALYKQDQAQHLPNSVRDKMAEAKNHYLFSISGSNNESDIAQVEAAPIASTINHSKNSEPERPISYETQKDRFTAKSGASILPQKKEPNPISSPAEISEPNLVGTTTTGHLNAELNSRHFLVKPNAQNNTKAKGRVMIKFCTNEEGVVTYAKFTQRGSTTLNAQLKSLAVAAVKKMRLAPVGNDEDCGVVGFDF